MSIQYHPISKPYNNFWNPRLSNESTTVKQPTVNDDLYGQQMANICEEVRTFVLHRLRFVVAEDPIRLKKDINNHMKSQVICVSHKAL